MGVSYAREVQGYDRKLLYNEKGDLDTVIAHLKFLSKARNCNRLSRVIIVNQSRYPLHYKNQGQSSGFFFSDVRDAFGNGTDVIAAKTGVGGFLSTKTSDTARGASGYFRLFTFFSL